MTVTTQRTMYMLDLSLAQLIGEPYAIKPNTTLNEKFSIEQGNEVPSGVYPRLKYVGIGTGGLPGLNQSPGYIYSDHSPMDAALFNQVPFVLRPLDNDLSSGERSKYRFRKTETINGKAYIAYYLKVIPNFSYDNSFFNITSNGSETFVTTKDMNDPKLLNPIPTKRTVNLDNFRQSNLVTKFLKFRFEINPEELKELRNVFDILGRDYQLTEIGLFSGLDTSTGNGTEAICVQAMFFFGLNLDMTHSFNREKSLIKDIELGGSEPILE